MTELWQPTPANATLTQADVHVWQINLDQSPERVAQLRQLLSSDEQTRADRFYFERDRRRYIVGRGTLRLLIGRYLDTPPSQVQFEYGSHGKPALAQAMGRPGFEFNLSNSQSLALVAFSWGRVLGIDVEFARDLQEAEAIAQRNFSPREFEIFRRLPEQQKQEAFFNCWTRKEAFIKAIGEGLSHPLDQFDVTFVPGDEARLIYVAGDAQEASRWRLIALHPAPLYPAALIVWGHNWQLTRFTDSI